MNSGSLRVRLTILAAATISISLIIAGVGFYYLFKKHVEQFVLAELNTYFEQLVSGVSINKEGALQTEVMPSDPRFNQPLGGLYWQIDLAGSESLRSRSLWDEKFNVPTPPETAEENHLHVMAGPGDKEVFALERLLIVPTENGGEKKIVVTIGLDRDRVQNAVSSFSREITFGLGALYAALLASSIGVILRGLKPLAALQQQVEKLRTGASMRIEDVHPSEVSSLVQEVNALVEGRERQLDRARQQAGNLAHGLKTPLTVLSTIADDVEATGLSESARDIRFSSSQMRDLVDRELARSRMATFHASHRSTLLPALERVVAVSRKAPRGDAMQWKIDVPPDVVVSIDPIDLFEILGNLLDNARKHGNTLVNVTYATGVLVIEDDGKGVEPDKLDIIAKRGVKLDERRAGSGLGLSIVKDLADVYDLDLEFSRSSLGGLQVKLRLPVIH